MVAVPVAIKFHLNKKTKRSDCNFLPIPKYCKTTQKFFLKCITNNKNYYKTADKTECGGAAGSLWYME